MAAFAAIATLCLSNKFDIFSIGYPTLHFFMKCYFNDILGTAGFLLLISIALTFQIKRPIQINILHVVLFTLLCGTFWEYITPLYRSETVSDPLDIIAYLIGALIFWYILGGRKNPIFINQRPSSTSNYYDRPT